MHGEAGEARKNPFRQHSMSGLCNEAKCFIAVELEMIEARERALHRDFQ
jgi:hypothetical protein